MADRRAPGHTPPAGTATHHRAAALALAGSLALYAVALLLYPGSGDQDAAIHALLARFPVDAYHILGVWARPLFSVPFVVPGQLGYQAIRVTTVFVCAGTAWLTYLTARRLGMPRPWLAIPLVLWQPALYSVGSDAMTEPVFALTLAAGFLAYAFDRPALSAALWSFLPLARPEGPFVLACVGAAWLPAAIRDPRRTVPRLALLALGMVVWELACIVLLRSPAFLRDTFPWQGGTSSPWRGTWHHYIGRWPQIVGWGVLPLWLAGVLPSARSRLLGLGLAMTLVVVVLHSYMYATGALGSTGFDRYFASFAPTIALVALAGVGAMERRWRRRRGWGVALAALLALEGVHAFATLDSNPNSYMVSATRDAVGEARRLVGDLHARPFLSADHYGFVFADLPRGPEAPLAGGKELTLESIDRYPRGTVVLWDDNTGDWWYHLSIDELAGRGFRVLWERRLTLQSPAARFYGRGPTAFGRRWGSLFGSWPYRDFRQAVLVKE